MLFSPLRKQLSWTKTQQSAHNNLAWLYATQGEHLKRSVELAERAVALDMNAARLDTLAYCILSLRRIYGGGADDLTRN